jgi:hypothetical protein
MNREELERLTKPELIELLLGLQRPDKTSRTSSKPPSTDWKGKREGSRPGGAKPGDVTPNFHPVAIRASASLLPTWAGEARGCVA